MKRTAIWMSMVVLAAAALGYMAIRTTASAGGTEQQAAKEATPRDEREEHGEEAHERPTIEGLKVAPVTVGESWTVIATTGKIMPNANRTANIGPRIAGRVTRVHVNAGDTVRQGQVLATMSSAEVAQARAAYRQAEARAQAARQHYQRQEDLASLGALSHRPAEEARSEHIDAQAELAEAQAEFNRAESELELCDRRLARTRELHQEQIVSRQELETAEAERRRDQAGLEAARAILAQAKSRVSLARDYRTREERVLKGNHLASKEVQAAKAEVTVAEVDMRAALDALHVLGASPGGAGDTVPLTSPISGRIVSRHVSLGEMIESSETLFVVMDLTDVWVEANVFEKDLAKVHRGQMVQVTVTTHPDRTFSGKVDYVSDVLDGDSRAAKIRCTVANAANLLKPEMFAKVSIITNRRNSALLIPTAAVLDDTGQKIVFTPCLDCKEDERAGKSACGSFDRRIVVLGSEQDDTVEVVQGLEPTDHVVTYGAFQLKTALGSGSLEAGCSDH